MSAYCKNHSDYSGTGCGQYLEFFMLILAHLRVIKFSAVITSNKGKVQNSSDSCIPN